MIFFKKKILGHKIFRPIYSHKLLKFSSALRKYCTNIFSTHTFQLNLWIAWRQKRNEKLNTFFESEKEANFEVNLSVQFIVQSFSVQNNISTVSTSVRFLKYSSNTDLWILWLCFVWEYLINHREFIFEDASKLFQPRKLQRALKAPKDELSSIKINKITLRPKFYGVMCIARCKNIDEAKIGKLHYENL